MIDSEAVEEIRFFAATGVHLGIAKDGERWWVLDRRDDSMNEKWHLHSGPYSDRAQAVGWINDIVESPEAGEQP